MAFKLRSCTKVGCLNNFQASLARFKHTAAIPVSNSSVAGQSVGQEQKQKNFHVSAAKCYPAAPTLPLPGNMIEIFGNETGRFTSERVRDITGPVMAFQSSIPAQSDSNSGKPLNFGSSDRQPNRTDSYVDSYDCTGSVSLNSSMQSNVPVPFSSDGKSMHLNMPGGHFSRDNKYIAEDMQNSHYATVKFNLYQKKRGAGANTISTRPLTQISCCQSYISSMGYSTESGSASKKPEDGVAGSITLSTTSSINKKPGAEATGSVALSRTDRLKRAVKDYGSTVIVFHVGISLASLGACYLAVSSGLDVSSIISSVGFNGGTQLDSMLTNSSTFVVAYAIHKLFAPIRISITLGVTPFLVNYLRKVGFLKAPKP